MGRFPYVEGMLFKLFGIVNNFIGKLGKAN